MIIVSGSIRTKPGQREALLAASGPAIPMARKAAGCRAFVVAADPIEADLVNVYEEWDDEAAMLKFRGSGPSDDMTALIASANVRRHQISSSGPA